MAKFCPSSGLEDMINQIKAKGKRTTIEDFNKHGLTNMHDSVFQLGCVIKFPPLDEIEDYIDFEEFSNNGRKTRAPYIAVDSTEGPKKFFLTQATRKIQPFIERDGGFVVWGDPIHSYGEFYDICSTAKTAGDLLKILAGKEIEVFRLIPVTTARYANGAIVGLRTAQVPCFHFKN